jgi:hypothetical protein
VAKIETAPRVDDHQHFLHGQGRIVCGALDEIVGPLKAAVEMLAEEGEQKVPTIALDHRIADPSGEQRGVEKGAEKDAGRQRDQAGDVSDARPACAH